MTGLRLPRLSTRARETNAEETGDWIGAFDSLLNEVGQVKAGSLEEAIWCELGALPRSRRWGKEFWRWPRATIVRA
jgi:hypothetical protein